MTQQKTIKYFDIVINNIEDVTFFSPNNILHDNGNLLWETDEEKDEFNNILVSLISFGKTYDYLKKKGTGSWYYLTPKGIDLKNYSKGHSKFQKKSKSTPLTKYQKIYLPLFVISLLFGLFKTFQAGSIKNDYNNLKIELDSLNAQSIVKDKIIDTLFKRIQKVKMVDKPSDSGNLNE